MPDDYEGIFKQPKVTIHKGKQNNLKQPCTSKMETINNAENSCLEEQKNNVGVEVMRRYLV